MEKKVVVSLLVGGLLGVAAMAMGFAAQSTSIKTQDLHITSYTCKYSTTPSLGLGVTAAVFLLVAMIIINAQCGCICCPPRPFPCCAIVLCIFSWLIFINAFMLLLIGAATNQKHTYTLDYSNGARSYDPYCYVRREGVFITAAVESIVSVVLSIICAVLIQQAKSSNPPPLPQFASTGIAMGAPAQYPPPPYNHANPHYNKP